MPITKTPPHFAQIEWGNALPALNKDGSKPYHVGGGFIKIVASTARVRGENREEEEEEEEKFVH